MASLIYLDTHVAAWLFAGRVDLLAAAARDSLERNELLLSPAAILELEYLFEIQRTAQPSRVVLETLERELGVKVCDLPFPEVVKVASEQAWTRDPFDRLIVGQAMLRGVPLLTKDRHLRDHCPRAFWDQEAPASEEASGRG